MFCTCTPVDCIDSEFWYSLVPSSCLSPNGSSAESFIRMTIRSPLCAMTWHSYGLLGRWSSIQAWASIGPSGSFVSCGAFWGLFCLMIAFSCMLPRGWLSGRRSSGMISIKVHEWCLVCYGWLIVCLCRNCHAFLPCETCYLAPLPLVSCGLLCCIPNRWHCLANKVLFRYALLAMYANIEVVFVVHLVVANASMIWSINCC